VYAKSAGNKRGRTVDFTGLTSKAMNLLMKSVLIVKITFRTSFKTLLRRV